MYLLYSIFSFSVIASFSMIFFRLWELENGKIPFPDFLDRKDLAKQFQIFAVWEKKAWEEGKRVTLRVFSSSLKVFVSGIDQTRKLMRKLIIRTEEALVKKRANEEPQGASSFFLKDIAEHKRRMKTKNRV